jgi:hypothetical protein
MNLKKHDSKKMKMKKMNIFKNVDMQLADNPSPAPSCSLVVRMQSRIEGGLARVNLQLGQKGSGPVP